MHIHRHAVGKTDDISMARMWRKVAEKDGRCGSPRLKYANAGRSFHFRSKSELRGVAERTVKIDKKNQELFMLSDFKPKPTGKKSDGNLPNHHPTLLHVSS